MIKDYLYPITLAFISAIIGGFIGYLGILWRENKEIEKAKINATSNLLLEATDCFHNLIAIKDNYAGKLTDHPVQRLVSVRPILMHHRPSIPEFTGMLFISRGAKKAIKDGLIEDNKKTYLNISRIKLLFENYNTLLEMWKTRNELALPIFEKVVFGTSGTGVSKVTFATAVALVGHGKIAQLMDLNEKTLSLTDDLLEGYVKLMDELPEVSELFISEKVMRKHGRVIRCDITGVPEKLLAKVPVNEEMLNDILEA